MGKYDQEKQTVLNGTRWLSKHKYLGTRSSGGNVSIKVLNESGLAITPSGKPYFQLTVDDICVIDFDHNPIEATLSPSIESAMHIGVYKHRRDVQAVIHTHQTFVSLLSIINRSIPALFDEIIVEIGHVVEIVPYAFSGSAELVQNVISRLGNECQCYIIQNHGALCLGANMNSALKNTELLENIAQVYYYALIAGQEISTLPRSAIEHFDEMRKLRL